MDRIYESGAAGSPPSAPANPSFGYPTAGNPSIAVPATRPGPWWYHMMTEELMAVIADAGIAPQGTQLDQLKTALDVVYARNTALAAKADVSALAGKADVSALAGKADKEVIFLPDGTDLNTLNLDGRYNGAALVNAPNGDYYFIEVFRHDNFIAGSNEWLVQRATGMTSLNMGKTFIRNEYAPANWTAWQELATVAQTRIPLFHAREVQPRGTNATAGVAGWNVRVLNTVLVNEIAGASLANNIITLPAGTYDVEAWVPSYMSYGSAAFLRNNANGVGLIPGLSVQNFGGNYSATTLVNLISGRIVLTETTQLTLYHWVGVGGISLGVAVGATPGLPEVYSNIQIRRIA